MPIGVYIRTKPVWNKGRKGKQRNHNIAGLRLGWNRNKDKDPDRLTYSGKHQWIHNNWGRASYCEHCLKTLEDKISFQWSNKDGKYLLNRADWQQLCPSCHKIYDNKMSGFSSWLKGNKGLKPWMNLNGLVAGGWNNTHTVTNCLNCNKLFNSSPSAKRKYCSGVCARAHLPNPRRGGYTTI